MSDEPKTTEFAAQAGISMGYASMILRGKRVPPLTTAISIFRKTGRKFGPIATATDEDIEVMERVYGAAA
jgi:transcriptional regulator with XRE-family HTH domain